MARRKGRGGRYQPRLPSGYRSGFEQTIAAQLTEADVRFEYEKQVIPYSKPVTVHKYTPDFVIYKANGSPIFIETKGWFPGDDQKKMKLVKACNPLLDIRIVFEKAHRPIRKGAILTYARWCVKYGFPWAHQWIDPKWFLE